jgi:hypothetical protein
MIVEHPRKCPNCQSRKWSARDFIETAADRDLEAVAEYGRSRNFACVSPPAWDNDAVEDLRSEMFTSIIDGWEWARLIAEWLEYG